MKQLLSVSILHNMFAILLAFATLLSMSQWTQAAADSVLPRVVIISNDFVLTGKFTKLHEMATNADIGLVTVNIDQDDDQRVAEVLQGAKFVLLDAPREEDGRRIRERVGSFLEKANPPWLLISARGALTGGGLAQLQGEQLYAYYRNGSARNFSGFFAYLRYHLFNDQSVTVPEAVVFLETAIYHPDYPDLVFPDLASYRNWLREKPEGKFSQPRPAIGIVFHQSYLANMNTGPVDELIRKIEARGALPVAFYYPIMAGPGIFSILMEEGKSAIDVLINQQIMYDSNRHDDYAALDVPVLQTLTWREGDAADWRSSNTGIPTGGVPFYFAIPEHAGLTDPLIIAAQENGEITLIPEQTDALIDKAFRLIDLRSKSNAEKRIALLFYNYPPGEKNLSASFMNVPRSLSRLTAVLADAGYRVDPADESMLIDTASALLAPFYRDNQIDALLARDLAGRLPLAEYRAWYDAQPEAVRNRIEARWGAPEDDPMLIKRDGDRFFAVPRLQLGNLLIMPQPPRGRAGEPAEKAIYHDTLVPLTHFYLAAYLYIRQAYAADALVHFGTHGSQEWTPGKERGLSIFDDPYLVLGDIPVIYPYIVDNIGEAIQTKRRGRATVVSHQTPPFAPAGLHEQLLPLHDLIHQYELLDEGAVKSQTIAAIVDEAAKLNLIADIGWTNERAAADFIPFERELHDWLHELARTAQPLGLHTFGEAPDAGHRVSTVMQILGERLYTSIPLDDPDELFADDYRKLVDSPPYQALATYLLPATETALSEPQDEKVALDAALLGDAKLYFESLAAGEEHNGLLTALAGRFLTTQYGGDPIRNPESLPTGRNLYGFDPSRVPTEQAYKTGGALFAQLLAAHRSEQGSDMRKIAFSMWSVETMRHLGVLEAQIFHALGVRPVWDNAGRITDTEIISRSELGRPRVDVVVSATGLYRDHFPNVMRHIAQAIEKVAALDEPDNAVRLNTLALEKDLLAQGYSTEDAREYALTRIFSNQSGTYGTGLDDATLASDTWENETKLAELYLARMQYAYGPTEARWGYKPEKTAGSDSDSALNLYVEQLKGVESAVLSRSSNTYGMLTTDDPFQYLGGIGLAVRHITGKSPQLYISNLRNPVAGKIESAGRFLAGELRARYLHPQWIAAMQQEGYAGTLNVLDSVNNFWGWTAVAPEIVRDDQWQSFFEVYINDSLNMDMDEWFEQSNPVARAQIAERMLEAVRKEYWQTDDATLQKLTEVYLDAMARLDYQPASSKVDEYVRTLATGFGLNLDPTATPEAEAKPEAATSNSADTESVTGQVLETVSQEVSPSSTYWQELLLIALIVLAFLSGFWRQSQVSQRTANA